MQSALLLNADMSFHDIVHWQDAVCMVLDGKAQVLEEYDADVRSMSFSLKLPAVLKLFKYVRKRPRVKLTRANILARDKFVCQYCPKKLRISDCTLDHVIPIAQGGRRVWENIVASCLPCNSRKANRTPEQARMQLRQVPYRPRDTDVIHLTLSGRNIHELWRSYLYWNVELENDITD